MFNWMDSWTSSSKMLAYHGRGGPGVEWIWRVSVGLDGSVDFVFKDFGSS